MKFFLNQSKLSFFIFLLLSAPFSLFSAEEQAIEEVIATAKSIKASQMKAIEAKRISNNVADIISADAIGRFPDQNLADALGRIPGVSIERDQGQARYINFRGTPKRYTTIAFDGIDIPGTENGRVPRFDSYPAVITSQVVANKAITADMPGESISGYINVKTYRPSDNPGWTASFELGQGEQDLGGGDIEKANGRVGFSNDSWGILVFASENLREQMTQNREVEYGVVGERLLTPDKIDFRNYLLERKDEAVGATLEAYLGNGGRVYYSHLSTQFDDFEERNQFRFYAGARAARKGYTMAPNVGSIPSTYIRRLLEFGEYHNETDMHTIGAEITVGEWDVTTTFSKIETFFDTWLPLPYYLRGVGTNFTYDLTNPQQPIISIDENLADISYPVAVVYTAQARLKTDTDQFKIDMSRYNDLGELKVGFKYDSRDGGGGGLGLWVGGAEGSWSPGGALPNYDSPDQLYIENDWTNSIGAFYTNNRKMREDMEAQGLVRSPYPEDQLIAIKETILSAYVSQIIEKDWGNFIIGARVEDTDYDTIGQKLVGTTFSPLTVNQTYTSFLPNVHLNYNLDEDKKLRLSLSTGISRPTYHESRAAASISAISESISGGNPFLEEEKSWGIDAAYEHYFAEASLFSVSFFMREIDNVIFTDVSEVLGSIYSDAAAEGDMWTLEGFGNGDDGKLNGLEIAFTGRLDNYMEGFWSGFGFTGNVTAIDSEFTAPGGTSMPSLPGQSDLGYNASVFYEQGDLTVRVNYMWRDDWFDEALDAQEDTVNIYWKSQKRVDASIRYDLERITGMQASLFLNLNNMTDETDMRYKGDDWNPNQVEAYGKRYLAGIRFNF